MTGNHVIGNSSGRFPVRFFVLCSLAILSTAFFFAPFAPVNANPMTATATPSVTGSQTGILVPLYSSPTDGSWAALIQAKLTYHSVAMIAIINPQNGPGSNASLQYSIGIQQLQAAGIMVLGYVATGHATIPIASAEQNIADYWWWYHVNGTMFDEMSSESGHEGYYSTLNAYAKSLGMTYTVGNPGGAISSTYIGIMNTLIVYENSGLPNATSIASLYQGYPRTNFAVISYGIGLGQPRSVVAGIATAANYVYFTNSTLPNPYRSLPGYFMTEVSLLSIKRR